MKTFKNKQEKQEFKKVLKGIKRLKQSMKPKPIYLNIKEKFRLYEEEKELFNIVLKVVSIVTYIAIILTTIVCDDFVARYAVLNYMIVSTLFLGVTLGVLFIARKFIK